MAPERQLFLAGRLAAGAEVRELRAPWDGSVVAQVHQGSWAQWDEALALAHRLALVAVAAAGGGTPELVPGGGARDRGAAGGALERDLRGGGQADHTCPRGGGPRGVDLSARGRCRDRAGGRSAVAGSRALDGGRARGVTAGALGGGGGDLSIQFSVEPGRPQGGPGARDRRADGAEALAPGALGGPAAGGDQFTRRARRGRRCRSPSSATTPSPSAGPPIRGRRWCPSLAAAPGWAGSCGPRCPGLGWCWSSAGTRRWWSPPTPTWIARSSASPSAATATRGRPASRCNGSTPSARSIRASWRPWKQIASAATRGGRPAGGDPLRWWARWIDGAAGRADRELALRGPRGRSLGRWRGARGEPARARGGGRAARGQGHARRGVRAGGGGGAVRRLRGGVAAGQRGRLRAASGPVHPRPAPDPPRLGRARGRRVDRRRRADLPRGQHALRRGQGLGTGREGVRSAIRDLCEPRLLVMARG